MKSLNIGPAYQTSLNSNSNKGKSRQPSISQEFADIQATINNNIESAKKARNSSLNNKVCQSVSLKPQFNYLTEK